MSGQANSLAGSLNVNPKEKFHTYLTEFNEAYARMMSLKRRLYDQKDIAYDPFEGVFTQKHLEYIKNRLKNAPQTVPADIQDIFGSIT